MLLWMAGWNPDEVRRALRAFQAARKLKVSPWADRAKVAESTLRNFLAERSDSMTLRTLSKLAAAEGVSLGDMLRPEGPLSDSQKTAVQIAGQLSGEDLDTWLKWGCRAAGVSGGPFTEDGRSRISG